MNYIVLNDNDFFENIVINNFKEVSINGRERVDGVFGNITDTVLAESSEDGGARDSVLGENWFYGDSGVIFMVLRVSQNILYDGTGESLERCLGLFNPEDVYVEMGAFMLKNKENTYEYFLIVYRKSLGFHLIFDEGFLEKERDEIVPFICKKIEKKIL